MTHGFFHLDELSFAYPQHGKGLNAISLDICPGDAMLIEGPSGCGKSTLARCLVGLIPHLYHGRLEGSAWLDGQRTDRTPLWQLTRRAGLVFQNPAAQMLGSSVEDEIIFGLENLGVPRTEILSRLDEACAAFGLESLRQRSPQTLSGGEQQKLALACMLARGTPALVLDEPLSMLDPTAATEFAGLLAGEIRSGKTLAICEHRREYLAGLPGLRTLPLGNCQLEDQAGSQPVRLIPARRGTGFEIQVDNLRVAYPAGFTGGRRNARGDSAPSITIHMDDASLQRLYLPNQPVFADLSLSLPGGEMVALVGRNGTGKTTLLRALAGLQPYQGRITARLDSQEQKPDLGIIFQNPDLQLFNPSVREEILYRVTDPDQQLYRWLLDALHLAPYEAVPPLLLSEGEKRRVALATILMRQPRHGILLDEPSLGQDRQHKRILIQALRALADSGRMVMFATHDLELAFQADRLILLSQGEILLDRPPIQARRERAAWEKAGLHIPAWLNQPAEALL